MVKSRREVKEMSSYHSLYWYASKYYENVTKREDIEEIDITYIYYADLKESIKRGEITIQQGNAKMRLGKSTAMLSVALTVFEELKDLGHIKKSVKFGTKNIAMDQMEFDYKMRDPETTFTVIHTDEENQSEETGQDISVIKALQNDQSNIQADRYVHRTCASPTGIIDPNTDIILDMVYMDQKNMRIKANVTYRWYEELTEKTQFIGYIWIPVGHIIHNWVSTVKPKYYDKLKLESELSALRKKKNTNLETKSEKLLLVKIDRINKFIKEWEKKDWYIRYYMKKRKKIELVTKYKITKPRILKYAPTIVKVIDRFKNMCKHTSLVKKEMVKNNIKLEMKKQGMPQSIVGEELTTQEVMGVLDGYKGFWTIKNEQDRLDKKFKKGVMSQEVYNIQHLELEELKNQMMKNIKLQENEYERALLLLEEYEEEYNE